MHNLKFAFITVLWLIPFGVSGQITGEWYTFSDYQKFIKLEIKEDYLVTINALDSLSSRDYVLKDIDTVHIKKKRLQDNKLYVFGKDKSNKKYFAKFVYDKGCRCLQTAYIGYTIKMHPMYEIKFEKAIKYDEETKPLLKFFRKSTLDSFRNLKKLRYADEQEFIAIVRTAYEDMKKALETYQTLLAKGASDKWYLQAYNEPDIDHITLMALIKNGFSFDIDMRKTQENFKKYKDSEELRKLYRKFEKVKNKL